MKIKNSFRVKYSSSISLNEVLHVKKIIFEKTNQFLYIHEVPCTLFDTFPEIVAKQDCEIYLSNCCPSSYELVKEMKRNLSAHGSFLESHTNTRRSIEIKNAKSYIEFKTLLLMN